MAFGMSLSNCRKQCHTNAVNLALDDDSLIYCEGYALFKEASLPVVHAWVTDGNGKAIDNTLAAAGCRLRRSALQIVVCEHDGTEESCNRQPAR